MPQLVNSTAYVTIDGHSYSKNHLNYFIDSESTFFVYWGQQPQRILYKGSFDQWTDLNGTPYASIELLQIDLNAFLFGGGISLNSGGQVDAGNRLRVSQITTLLDLKQINDNQPLLYDRENIGGATQTYVKNKGGVTMAVTSNNDVAIVQSKTFATYFSGKSQFMEITFSGFQSQTNVTKRAGYFSSNTTTPFNSNKDGLWFESTGSGYYFIIQKNGVDVLNVEQANWSEVNPQMDFSKFQVLVVQFLYLGGTAVRFGFIVDGVIQWLHTYVHAGLVADTFVESPQQPVRYEIRSTGGSGSFDQICAQVGSEGSINETGVHRHLSNGGFSATVAGTEYALLGFRLKTAYRNIVVEDADVALLATTNDSYIWRLRFNPTVAGTFTYNDVTNSSVQLASGATANTITAPGDLLAAEGYGTGTSSIEADIKSTITAGSNIDGTRDTLVLTVTPLSNNLTIYSSLGIREYV